jgi:hypothetical protein
MCFGTVQQTVRLFFTGTLAMMPECGKMEKTSFGGYAQDE